MTKRSYAHPNIDIIIMSQGYAEGWVMGKWPINVENDSSWTRVMGPIDMILFLYAINFITEGPIYNPN
jgi:hypothetical protein